MEASLRRKTKNKAEEIQLVNLAVWEASQEKRKVVDENMKKYIEDDVNYCIMSELRQHFVKLGNYGDWRQ